MCYWVSSIYIDPKLEPAYAMPGLINAILPADFKGVAICGF